MGFFSTLKNTLTGSWARVHVYCEGHAAPGAEVVFVVHVLVNEESIDVRGVSLTLREVEAVSYAQLQHYERAFQDALRRASITERVSLHTPDEERAVLSERVFPVEAARRLEAQEEYVWRVPFTLPRDALHTFQLRHTRHLWTLRAAVQMRGVNPSSGEEELQVYAR